MQKSNNLTSSIKQSFVTGRFITSKISIFVFGFLLTVCSLSVSQNLYAYFWPNFSIDVARYIGSFMFYGGIAVCVGVAVATRSRWGRPKQLAMACSLALCACMLVTPVASALTPLPSDRGPGNSSAYKFSVPFTEYQWIIAQFRDGTYYAINGSDWNIMTIVEPWQPVAPWAALASNLTALEEQVLASTTSGKILLNEVAYNYNLTIPANVTVIESYNGLTRQFINSANTQGSPYTISVDTVQTGYYLAQDSADRYIDEWSSTNCASVGQSVLDAAPDNSTIIFKGNLVTTQQMLIPSYRSIIIDGKITVASGSNCGIFENKDKTTGNYNIEISGGQLNGNKNSQSAGSLIYFDRASNYKIHDIQFLDAKISHIKLEEIGYGQIYNNDFNASGYTAIYITDGAAGAGWSYADDYGGQIFNNHFYRNYGGVVFTDGGGLLTDWWFMDNWMDSNGISVSVLQTTGAVSDIQIYRNYIDYPLFGVYAENPNAVRVVGNTIEEARQHAIYYFGLQKRNYIVDNYIMDSGCAADDTYDGIYIVNTTSSTYSDKWYESLQVTGNTISTKHTLSYGTDHRNRYGLNILVPLDNATITDNTFIGASGGLNFTCGANCRVEDNMLGTISNGYTNYDTSNYKTYIDRAYGITPTATVFGVAPANLAAITDGDFSTASGIGSRSYSSGSSIGYIQIDLGAVYEVTLIANFSVTTNSSNIVNVYWYTSTDGVTYTPISGSAAFAQAANGVWVTSNGCKQEFAVARYIQLGFTCTAAPTAAQIDISGIEARDYSMGGGKIIFT